MRQLKHLVDIIVRRAGIDIGDQFKANSRKVKFVVESVEEDFPQYTDFDVVHHYLKVPRICSLPLKKVLTCFM